MQVRMVDTTLTYSRPPVLSFLRYAGTRALLLTLTALVLILAAPSLSIGAKPEPMTTTGLRWPTDSSRRFTSTFGEPRPDRFHAGLDFSTSGSAGYPCYAVADGWVTRVKLDFRGYGKAVYLELPDGRIAVYAHLSAFDKRIEERVRAEQIAKGQYEVELFFGRNDLPFRQGELIAYTGDTGAGPPHLHFEMRNGIAEPYNPALDGFIVRDTRPPVVRRLSIRPLDGSSEVEGDMLPVVRWVNGNRAEPVSFYGRVGISAEVLDWQDGGWHRLGVRSIELFLNGELRHRSEPSRFNYRLNRQSRLDFDYELWRVGYKRFRRLYILPGNELPFYDRSLPGGVIDSRLLDPGKHEIRLRVTDNSGNTTEASWTLISQREPVLLPAAGNGPSRPLRGEVFEDPSLEIDIRLIGRVARVSVRDVPDWADRVQVRAAPFAHALTLTRHAENIWIGRGEVPLSFRGPAEFIAVVQNRAGQIHTNTRVIRMAGFRAGESDRWSIPSEGVELRFDPGDLYFDLIAGMTKLPSESNTLTPLFAFHPMDHPFQRPFEVAFTADDAPWDSLCGIVYREEGQLEEWTWLGNQREMNGFVLKGEAFSFETFSVVRDTVPPRISRVSLQDGALASTRKPLLSALVVDDLSDLDLKACRLELNGENTIWVYDPDAKTISFRPWENLPRGTHSWRLLVVDKVGNRREILRTFRVK